MRLPVANHTAARHRQNRNSARNRKTDKLALAKSHSRARTEEQKKATLSISQALDLKAGTKPLYDTKCIFKYAL